MCDNRNLVYLATAYTQGTDKLSKRAATKLKKERHKASNQAAAKMFEMGITVYSPITHGPLLEPLMSPEAADDWSRWIVHCLSILEHCAEVWVFCQEGWDKSAGVKVEVSYAMDHKLPVKYCWFENQTLDNLVGDFIVADKPKD